MQKEFLLQWLSACLLLVFVVYSCGVYPCGVSLCLSVCVYVCVYVCVCVFFFLFVWVGECTRVSVIVYVSDVCVCVCVCVLWCSLPPELPPAERITDREEEFLVRCRQQFKVDEIASDELCMDDLQAVRRTGD
jgi:hypothetical protein